MSLLLWTIGHSTRPIEELLALVKAQGISLVVDVRLIPFSRRNPQFNTQALAESLARAGLHYHHLPALGGRRKARPDSINLGWRSAGFRGYADYMQTAEFWRALEELMRLAEGTSVAPAHPGRAETRPFPGSPAHPGRAETRPFPGTAIMCAEAVPWRCHRMLISDALVARGWTVRHILSAASAEAHSLTPFARLDHDSLTYPLPTAEESPPRLW